MNLPLEVDKALAHFLLQAGRIAAEQLKQVEKASVESGRSICSLLIENNHIDEERIALTITERMGVHRMQGVTFDSIPKDVLGILPVSFILSSRLVPLALKDDLLSVGISDPHAMGYINSVRTLTNLRVNPRVILLSEIAQICSALQEIAFQKSSDANLRYGKEAHLASEKPAVPASSSKPAKVPKEEGEHEVVKFVNELLYDAVRMKASDIHLEPYKNSSRVRFRIDGVLAIKKKSSVFLNKNYSAISTRIKIMANLNIAERRLPQDGTIAITPPNGNEVDLRVSVLPTASGERITMRILDRNAMSLALEDLGFPSLELGKFTRAIDSAHGLVLVTGPTGSGKTTTLYGALHRLNNPEINIVTAEDPIEFSIEGLGQVQIRDDIGRTFSVVLRSFLRQDPDIILVGEIRDHDTADICIKAALTGHMVLSTLHTNNALSTITRLINMGTPGYLIAAAVSVIIGQRLVRRNCPDCTNIDVQHQETVLVEIGFTPEEASRLLPKCGRGCDSCGRTGYRSRLGVYEVLPLSERLRAAIAADAEHSILSNIALEEGFRSMQQNGRDLIAQGLLSVKEFQQNLIVN